MVNRFDELAKSLAGGVPRREALRRLGIGLGGALLASVGLGKKGWADGPPKNCAQLCKEGLSICAPGSGFDYSACVSICANCTGKGFVFEPSCESACCVFAAAPPPI